MKISLITCCYNSGATLADTIDSVRQQDLSNVEYIVVDGASKDQTLSIIKDNLDIITQFVSEPDRGIYDAMNKGLGMTTGDVVGFLHSDDLFYSPDALRTINMAFEKHKVDAIYGDLLYVNREDTSKVIRTWKSQPFRASLFYKGWMPAHPTFYLRKSAYEKHGYYNTDFQISADYELMLRMLLRHGCSARYVPETLIRMRVGGESNVSLTNRWKANQEDAQAWKINGLKPGTLTRWIKPLSKLSQFLNKE